MQRLGRHYAPLALIAIGCLVQVPKPIEGREPLKIQISPSVARAPALLTVRVTRDATAEDRLLQVVAESSGFYRSSQVQLDGTSSAPLTVFEFSNLPSGTYEVTGVLIGTRGPRATVSRIAQVMPSPGAR